MRYTKVKSFAGVTVSFIVATKYDGDQGWISHRLVCRDLSEDEYPGVIWRMVESASIGDLPKMTFAIFPNVEGWGDQTPIYSERGAK